MEGNVVESGVVLKARNQYLAENGWTVEAYDAAWTEATVFGVSIRVPNTAAHRRGIMLHDLHHVATGYGTDLIGEGEVSAWEMHRGFKNLGLYVSSIVFAGMMLGLAIAPRRTLAAWRASGEGERSLFAEELDYEALLATTVPALRERLHLPPEGLSAFPRRLHARAPQKTAAA